MHISRRNEKIYIALFGIGMGLLLLWSCAEIIRRTGFWKDVKDVKTLYMLGEFLLLYLLLLGVYLGCKGVKRVYGYAFISFVFLWLHQLTTAFVVTGLYVLALYLAGEVLLLPLRRKELSLRESPVLHAVQSLSLGCMLYIVCICLLSLLHIGRQDLLLIFTLSFGLVSGLLYLYCRRLGILPLYFVKRQEDEGSSALSSFFLLHILFLLLAQASRLNVSLDYDSLRYALRTPYVLNNGRGIYENLGLVNAVYYYPKGLEILTLPLHIGASYSFIQVFSFLSLLGVLFVAYEILRTEGSAFSAGFGLCLLCFMPALMNMGISAKTDMITLFFQLSALLSALLYLKRREGEAYRFYLDFFWGSLLFTTVFKPTAPFFSGIIAAVFLGCCLWRGLQKESALPKYVFCKEVLVFWGLCLSGVFLVHLRTYLLTGHFFGSVFSGFWEKLGLHIHYPFKAGGVPAHGYGKQGADMLADFGRRFYGLFIAPVGEDMLHVYIAFAGSGILLMFLCSLAGLLQKRAASGFLQVLNLLLFLFTLYTLLKLYQIDGNYYLLFYVTAVMAFVLQYGDLLWRRRRLVLPLFIPSCLFSFLFICVSSWAAVLGNGGVETRHYGYLPHEAWYADECVYRGEGEIYAFLAQNPRARLVSMAYPPRGILFPLSAQSYTDITGSGGNVRLVKYLDDFKAFLDYAETDYIYTEEAFLELHPRAKEMIGYMVEEQSVELLFTARDVRLYRYIGRK